MAMRTDKYGLPYLGGWMEQPAGMIERMDICRDSYMAYYDYSRIPPGNGAKWQQNNPDKWAIVSDYLGLTNGTN